MNEKNSTAFEDFCGGSLWAPIKANSSEIVITQCFQSTVLVWVPCFFIYNCFPLYLIAYRKHVEKQLMYNWLNISRLVLCSLLCLIFVVDLGKKVYQSTTGQNVPLAALIAPGLEFIAMLMALVLIQLCRLRAIVASCVLFIYWLLQSIAALTLLIKVSYDYGQQDSDEDDVSRSPRPKDTHHLAQCAMTFGLCVAELVLAQIVDGAEHCSAGENKDEDGQKPCPEHDASPLSIMTFWWFTGMAVKGYKKPLEKVDMWLLNEENTSRYLNPIFEKFWNKQKKAPSVTHTVSQLPMSEGDVNETEVQLQPLKSDGADVAVATGDKEKHPGLVKTLVMQFWPEFLVTAFHKLIHDMFMFVNPQILSLLLVYIKRDDAPLSIGIFYASLMLIVSSIESVSLQQYFHHSFRMGMNLRTCIVGAVYRKSLRLSSAARQSSTIGEIVNLMSVDAQRFVDLMTHLHMIWSAPFQIIVCLFFLWQILGPSVLAGFGVLVCVLPVNAWLARKTRELQSLQMKQMDVRVKQTHEMLNGVKVIKLYAWEKSFMDRILEVRGKELAIMKRASYLNSFSAFMWMCVPFLVSLVTFAVYVLSSPDNILTAEKTFVALALFGILRFPISIFPMLIGALVQVAVSCRRLQAFLTLPEVNPDDVTRDPNSKNAISVENGSFSWEEKAEPTLHDINVSIAPHSLVAVVGAVGSGKSALLSAMLGEMHKKQGTVTVKGSVALVTQQAWIQNATLKSNILFGHEMKDNLYERVLDACALQPDIKILPGGDMTEIGEKGINLSGGQKQRVSLARAVYANADTYLLDDPLSAVDSHVGKHLFDKVIGPEGLLKRKTRILVTHGIRYLPHVDQIIVLVGGRVTEVGTFQQLLDNNGAFADFLRQYIQELGDEAKEELAEVAGASDDNRVVAHLRQLSVNQDAEKINARQFSVSSETSDGPRSRKNTLSSPVKGDGAERKASVADKDKPKPPATSSKLMTVEKAEAGTVKLNTFTSYLRAIGIPFTIATVIFVILADVLSVSANFWLADWSNDANNVTDNAGHVNETLAHNDTATSPQHVHMRLAVYAALGLCQGLAVLLASFSLVRGCISASETTHRALLNQCLRYPMNFFDTTPTGRLINRFSKDIDVLDSHLPRNIQWWLRCATAVLAMLFVISLSTPIFLLPASLVGVLYFFVQRFYVATSRQLIRLESVGRSPIYSHFGETVQGITTIRAYGRQQEFQMESEARVDGSQIFYFPNIVANRWLAIRLEFVGNLIIFLAALLAVLGRSTMSPGTVGLSITYALMVTQTLNWVVRISSELEGNLVALERIREYCEQETEASWEVPETKPAEEWPQQGLVKFNSYSTRYRAGLDLVLNEISCTIQPGEKVGIVGRTGAGKSSLTLALFRVLEPSGGDISIDDVNIMKIGLHDLRSRLTIIPQDPVLFSGTIRMNLDPFNTYSDEKVWTSLEQSHLKDFVAAQPMGLQYECTEGGDNLSVGQRQLVCLARALLRHTKVLILDEATASVDMETDDLIQATIRSEFKDCTVVTIAHRLNTIMDYNRVMVLSSGQIVEFDSPKTLIGQKESLFCNMARDAGIVKQD